MPARRADRGFGPRTRGRPAPAPNDEAGDAPEREPGERLQRVLARAGYGSRRSVEGLIVEGRVRINGRIAELGNRVDVASDQVTVDGVPVPLDPGLRYFVLNKPPGVTSTMRDPHAVRSIAEYLPAGPRVVPVGRLDRDSEGLLVLTNDGDLAHRLQHPKYGIEKEYLVEVEGEVSRRTVARLTEGVDLEDGPAAAVRASVVQRGEGRSAVGVVMAEGRKREVRRMFAVLGHDVRRLVRVRIGPVRLGRLGPGKHRALEPEEVRSLYAATGLKRARAGRAGRTDGAAGKRPRGGAGRTGRRARRADGGRPSEEKGGSRTAGRRGRPEG